MAGIYFVGCPKNYFSVVVYIGGWQKNLFGRDLIWRMTKKTKFDGFLPNQVPAKISSFILQDNITITKNVKNI